MSSTGGNDKAGGWPARLRAVGVGLLIAVGCLGLGTYVLVHWAERQFLTTDNYVALVSPLPQQPVVSTALGNYIGSQVFSNVDVQQKVADALPPRAAFLAGPLTDQLSRLTRQTAQRVVASDQFQAVWTTANRAAMNRLLTTARGQTPPLQAKIDQKFNINLAGASGQLRGVLGKASAAIPALQPAAQKAITVSTDLRSRADKVRQAIRTIDALNVVLPLVAITGFLGALALSAHRRRTTLAIAISVFVLMLVELVAIKGLRQSVLDRVRNPANLPAVGYIFDTFSGWLKNIIYVVIGVSVFVGAVGYLSGRSSIALALQRHLPLSSIAGSKAMGFWHTARAWTRKYEHYLWVGVVIVVLGATALFVSVTWRAAINSLLLIISACSVIHIIATPHTHTYMSGPPGGKIKRPVTRPAVTT
ncbi:MAG TPA: hypothetical protein VGM08_03735 [Candidatus Saccharimonadales bacterium]|jgi:hypothetical protein